MNRRAAGLGVALLALAACGPSDRAAPDAETIAADPALLQALPAPYNSADLANGRRQFRPCSACHLAAAGAPHRVGPALHGVFGRPAGAAAGFAYSPALREAGFAWDAARLDAWLADPRGFLPGNRMSFSGVPDADDRRDLIAYLMIETAPPVGP